MTFSFLNLFSKALKFLFDLFLAIDLLIVPFAGFDISDWGSFTGIFLHHISEQASKFLRNTKTTLDALMNSQEALRPLKQDREKIEAFNKLAFQEGEVANSQQEEKDSSRENVSFKGIFDVAFNELRGSVILCSTRDDLFILFLDIWAIKIRDLDVEIAVNQKILEFNIEMSNFVAVKVFKTFNELSEYASGKLFIAFKGSVLEDLIHVSVFGKIIENEGGFKGFTLLRNINDFISHRDDRWDIFVTEVWESLFIEVRRVELSSANWEELHSILSIVSLIISKVNWELRISNLFD